MKKIYFFVFMICSAGLVSSQGLVPVLTESYKASHQPGLPGIQTIDTLTQYMDRSTGYTIYSAADGGYVFGTSYFYDSASTSLVSVTDETGIHFDAVSNASVTEILFWAGKAITTGTSDNISGNVYSVGADSMPVGLLGSGSVNMSAVTGSSTLAFSSIPLVPPVNTGGSEFFVSILYAGIDDTLGIVSTKAGDGLNEKRIRQLASTSFGGGWKRMGDLYNFLDLDVVIVPVVDIASGTGDIFQVNDAMLKPVYPSPARDFINIDYALKNSSEISFKLFDLSGKTIYERKTEKVQSGSYKEMIDISMCTAGKYYLTFTSKGSSVTQKVMIVK